MELKLSEFRKRNTYDEIADEITNKTEKNKYTRTKPS